MTSLNYQSKMFRVGNILLALILAVRGVPRHWQPEEQVVTLESGRAIYADEIALLDPIGPKLHIFQSGVLAAALVTVALHPETVAFWRRVNDENWTRHSDGRIDPAGWLLQWVLRHSRNRDLAQRPEYQHHLFQAGLAAAMAWQRAQASGNSVWLSADPPRVAIDQVLDQVCLKKGLRRTADGFRHPKALVGRLPALVPTEIEHDVEMDLAMQMADAVAELEPFAFDDDALSGAGTVLTQMNIPAELAAPAVLTAALITLARDPDCAAIWEDVFAGRWNHDGTCGSDIAGLITRAVQVSNRRPEGIPGQAQLLSRIMMAFKSHARLLRNGQTQPRYKNIPQARTDWVAQLVEAWTGLPIPDGPLIHACQVEPVFRNALADLPKATCSKPKGRSRDHTGSKGERSFERFHARCSLPRPGRLVDRTRDQCGWDYELHTEGEPLWVIEVKVVTGLIAFLFGSLQLKEAKKRRGNYWLVLVDENPDGEDDIYFIRDPSRWLKPVKQQRLVVQTTYTVKAKDWQRVATKDAKSLV